MFELPLLTVAMCDVTGYLLMTPPPVNLTTLLLRAEEAAAIVCCGGLLPQFVVFKDLHSLHLVNILSVVSQSVVRLNCHDITCDSDLI